MRKLSPKKVRIVFWIILAAGAAAGLTGAFTESDLLAVIGTVVMIGSLVFHFIFYRCPHCGVYLDRSTGDYCPCCGEKVDN